MVVTGSDCPEVNNPDKFVAPITHPVLMGDVDKAERKDFIIEFLEETRVALPRKALYRNLAYRKADFSDSSLKNYLGELREEGLVERIDAKKFANGTVQISDDDPGYWIITKQGVQSVEEMKSEDTGEDDIDTSHL